MKTLSTIVIVSVLFMLAPAGNKSPKKSEAAKDSKMELGAFSISLRVNDLQASKAFYEKLGFKQGHGDNKSWVVMRNGTTVIGLFQGHVEKNSLTFNPGWDQHAKNLDKFTDVRELQKKLKAEGLKLDVEADESTTGPAFFTLKDPDGNPILVDQHR